MEQTIIDKIKSGIETALDIKELGQIVLNFGITKRNKSISSKPIKK